MELYPEFTVLDAFYNAIQLFGFGGALATPLPWELEVARLLGPLLTGYAAVRGIIALSREQLAALTFRLFLRDHVVIAGLGDVGLTLAVRLYEAGARVIAIEVNPAASSVEGCRERGIPVLIGDATDSAILKRGRASQARLLVAACGDDATNAAVATVVTGLPSQRRGALTTLIHVEDPDLVVALEAWAIQQPASANLRVEVFNVAQTAIRLLCAAHPPSERDGNWRVLVAGDNHLADEIVLGLSKFLSPGAVTRGTVLFAGPAAQARVERLSFENPQLLARCQLHALEADAAGIARGRVKLPGGFDAAYVAFSDESATLAAALALDHGAEGDVDSIVAVVRREDAGAAEVLRGTTSRGSGGIVPFGILSQALTPALVLNGRTEILAEAIHEGYRRSQLSSSTHRSGQSDQSLLPWAALPATLKESNRAFAGSIGEKLRAAGWVAVPCAFPTVPSDGDWPGDIDLEGLARMEHDRWAKDLKEAGWTLGSVRDPEAKTHPSLIEYQDLSEAEREKDRAQIRNVPTVMAAAGFEIRKLPA